MAAGSTQNLRGQQRTACKIKATARCLGRESPAAVLDISEQGLSLYLRFDIGAEVGREVVVETEEFGRLTGEVCWARPPRIGISIGRSSNTAAKIDSYFKMYR